MPVRPGNGYDKPAYYPIKRQYPFPVSENITESVMRTDFPRKMPINQRFLRNWFDRNGWTLEDSANGVYQYTKGNAGAYFDCSGGTGQIQAGIISPQTPTSESGNARALIGEWSGGSMDGTLEFFSSNEWHFDYIINGTYSYTGSTLTLTSGGKQGTAQVTVSGNTLTIGRFSGTLTTEGINDVLPGTYRKQ